MTPVSKPKTEPSLTVAFRIVDAQRSNEMVVRLDQIAMEIATEAQIAQRNRRFSQPSRILRVAPKGLGSLRAKAISPRASLFTQSPI